jgi:hypothetical protein
MAAILRPDLPSDIVQIAACCDGFHRVGRGYRARYPAHNSKSTTSLSIALGAERTLLYCHAGCTYAEIRQALGLSQPAPSRATRSMDVSSAPSPADVATRDRVYHARLFHLALSPEHRANLRLRGLDDAHLQRGAYRSWQLRGRSAVAKHLVNQFGLATCASIPGFIQREGSGGRRYGSLAGAPGLVIPQRDIAGRIIALLLRPDDPTYGKYLALTSAKYGGPSPGSNIHVPCFVPVTLGADIRLTEGALKADVATALRGVLTLGIPGVAPWRMALKVLEQLQPKTGLLAWDATWRRQ